MNREMIQKEEVQSFGKFPQEWILWRLKYLMSLRKEQSYGEGELLSVYLDRGVISYSDSTGKQVHKPSEDLSKYQKVYINDFVLNNQQAWRGSVGISRYNGIISPAYFVYEMSEKCFPEYMNYVLRDKSMVQQYELSSRGVGSIQRNINTDALMCKYIVMPSISEQKQIASFLDRKCAAIDNAIEKTKESIAKLDEYKKSLITKTVTKGLNPNAKMKDSGVEWIEQMPDNWEVRRGKFILERLSRPVKDTDEIITCFRDGEVTLRKNRREEGFTMSDKEIGYQGIEPNDLVVHGMDGFAGSIGISDSRGKATPVLNVLDTKQDKPYLMYYLRSMAYGDVFNAIATGIRVRSCNLNWAKLAELPFAIPPIEEQRKIAQFIDKKLMDCNNTILQKQLLITKLEEYKKSLIYAAVTGKIDCTNEIITKEKSS